MTTDYFTLIASILTNPSMAQRYLDETEELLCTDPFNDVLLFANGMAEFQLLNVTAATVRCVEILKSNPPWLRAETNAQILLQLEKSLSNYPDASAIRLLQKGNL